MAVQESSVPSVDQQAAGRPFHPFLIALFPVCSLFAANVAAVPLKEAAVCAVAVLGMAAVLSIAANFALRLLATKDNQKGALLASWTIVCLFSYQATFRLVEMIHKRLFGNGSVLHGEYVLLVLFAGWLIGAIWLWRRRRGIAAIGRFANALAAVLFTLALFRVGMGVYGIERRTPSNKSIVDETTEQFHLVKPAKQRDIYYLVFDRYANSATLREKFDFDNSEFLQALADRGFQVANESRANYPKTVISMASALNMRYLPERQLTEGQYSRIVGNHVVGRLFVELGYDYCHFGNWYQPLRTNKNATRVMAESPLPSEFAENLFSMSPLSKFFFRRDKYNFAKQKCDEIAKLADDNRPTFVYAHFLLPHPPYVFNEDGSRLPWMEARYGNENENYAKQLTATNRLILEMIDKILEKSKTTPVIVLQSDEGPYLSEEDQKSTKIERMRWRTGILTALLLPPPERAAEVEVDQTFSPVNTFRLIFRNYFGAKIDLLPNTVFYWEKEDSKGKPDVENEHFVDVTAEVAKEPATDE